MYDQRTPIDLITVSQKLRDQQQLDVVGGIPYLSSLTDAVPSAANLEYYLNIVREKYLLRKVIQTCTGTIARVYEHEGEVGGLLDEVERDVLKISEERVESSSPHIRSIIHDAINTIEDYHQRSGQLIGVPSGFRDLDKLTGGFQNGDMIVLAARPSMGKTSLAMNIAEHVCLDAQLPVGLFSLEMTARSLGLRLLCSRSGIDLQNVRAGFWTERDFAKVTSAAGKIASAPLHIDDSSDLTILQLRAKARRMHQQHGIKLLIIDYLQLLKGPARRSENRQQEI